MVKARYGTLTHATGIPDQQRLNHLASDMLETLHHACHDVYQETIRLRKLSWMLSHVAEAVVVSAIYKRDPVIKANPHDLQRLGDQDPQLFHRMQHQFNKLRNKLMVAVERSILQDEGVDKAVGRVYMALPPREKMTSIRKLKRLQKITEAEVPRDFEPRGSDAIAFASGKLYDWHFDKATWGKIQDEYEQEYLGVDRSPLNVFDILNPYTDESIRNDIPSNEAFYGWEVEQETTHDFVTAVRDGEITAARENGVDDFMWIAILDKKTCEVCCDWRDGLSSKEIEAKLADQPELAESCDAIVPPAHFNCRCRVAPFSESLEPYEPDTDVELDEWLKSLS